MTMTNSREQFEATAADWFGLLPETIAQARMADGYSSPKLASAWRWWQFGRSGELRVVLSEPPGPSSQFVECEDCGGRGVVAGEWRKRDDGLWELVIKSLPGAPL